MPDFGIPGNEQNNIDIELPESGETLDELIKKKLRAGPLEGKERKKLADALLRRGYGWEEVRAALARHSGEAADDYEE